MMRVIRTLSVIVGSAVSGSFIGSLIHLPMYLEAAVHTTKSPSGVFFQAVLLTLPLTIVGSAVLATPIYLVLRRRAWSQAARYGVLTICGAAVGALVLGSAPGSVEFALVGAVYGAATAIAWSGAHWLTRSRRRSIRTPQAS